MKNGIIKRNRHRVNRQNRSNQNNNTHVDGPFSSENDHEERLDYRPARNRIVLQQNIDKYLNLARDSASSGDRVQAENYLQHADHFNRLLNEQKEIKQQFDQKKQQAATHNQAQQAVSASIENQLSEAEKNQQEELCDPKLEKIEKTKPAAAKEKKTPKVEIDKEPKVEIDKEA
ncbi:MAG: hypothetical protein HEEMFOPI_01244 [Holosporales bacterium]